MKVRTMMRMPIYALAAVGAKTLWDRYVAGWVHDTLAARAPQPSGDGPRRFIWIHTRVPDPGEVYGGDPAKSPTRAGAPVTAP